VGEDQVLLLDHLGGHLRKGEVFLTELLAAFFSGSVDTEENTSLLVRISERVDHLVAGLVVILVFEHVTAVAPPGRGGNFVVEETGGHALAPLLKTEPLQNVRLLTLTSELHGGALGVHVVHGVLPSLTRVVVELPAVLFLGGGPVGDTETLEHGTGLTVETDITHALKQSGRVEILSINVHHDVRLLVELVVVDILNANANITGLFSVELVGKVE